MVRWDNLSKKETMDLQNRKLRAFIRYQVYPYSPYYHALFKKLGLDRYSISKVDDLKKLPITRKEDIAPTKENPKKPIDIILQPTPATITEYAPKRRLIKLLSMGKERAMEMIKDEYSPIHITFTTGRSAAMTQFVFTKFDIDQLKEAVYRDLKIAEIPREYRCLNAFPFAPHLAYLASYYGMERNGNLTIHTGGGKGFGTKRIIDTIETFKPELLLFIPGYFYHLLRTAAEEGRDFSSVKKIGLAAEKTTTGMKKKMIDLLTKMGAKDPQIFALYAFTEARSAWVECSTFGEEGFHMYPDKEIVEIVNPKTGESVGEGEKGEIVFTPLDGRGSVILRYGTGDIAVGGLEWDKCPHCNRLTPRLSSDIRRVSMNKEFQLSKVKGTLVDLNAFSNLMSNIPEIEEWMVELKKVNDDPYDLDEFFVHVATRPNTDIDALKTRIHFDMAKNIEVVPTDIKDCKLSELLQMIGMETELKENRLIDRRPKL